MVYGSWYYGLVHGLRFNVEGVGLRIYHDLEAAGLEQPALHQVGHALPREHAHVRGAHLV